MNGCRQSSPDEVRDGDGRGEGDEDEEVGREKMKHDVDVIKIWSKDKSERPCCLAKGGGSERITHIHKQAGSERQDETVETGSRLLLRPHKRLQ